MKPKWYHHAILALGLVMLLAATIFALTRYGSISGEIPTHYSITGAPDRFSDKSAIFVILAISWGLCALSTVLQFFPGVWNTPVKLTPENRERMLAALRTMLAVLTLILALFFSATLVCMATLRPMPPFAVPLFLIGIFGTIVVSLVLICRKR